MLSNLLNYLSIFFFYYLVFCGFTFPIVMIQFLFPRMFFTQKKYYESIENFKEDFIDMTFSAKAVFILRSFFFYGTSTFFKAYLSMATKINIWFAELFKGDQYE